MPKYLEIKQARETSSPRRSVTRVRLSPRAVFSSARYRLDARQLSSTHLNNQQSPRRRKPRPHRRRPSSEPRGGGNVDDAGCARRRRRTALIRRFGDMRRVFVSHRREKRGAAKTPANNVGGRAEPLAEIAAMHLLCRRALIKASGLVHLNSASPKNSPHNAAHHEN